MLLEEWRKREGVKLCKILATETAALKRLTKKPRTKLQGINLIGPNRVFVDALTVISRVEAPPYYVFQEEPVLMVQFYGL